MSAAHPRASRLCAGVLAVLVTTVIGGCQPGQSSASAPPASGSSKPSTPPPDCTSSPWDCAQTARLQAAQLLIESQIGQISIQLRDRRTGALWQAGATELPMWAGSTPKLAVVVTVLEQARQGRIQLDDAARGQLDAMLSVSDNNAADAIWNRYINATDFMQRLRDRYGMTHATYVSGFPRRWGFIKCTSSDLVALMSYVLDELDLDDRFHLVHAMRTVGANQHWGVWSAGALLDPGVKNGWSQERDAGKLHWITATVGFAGPAERYLVAAMYHQPPGGDTIEHGVQVLSDLIATVFGARVPAAVVVPDDQ